MRGAVMNSDLSTIAAEAGRRLAVKIVAASDALTTEFLARALHDASEDFVQSSLAEGFPRLEIEAALTVMADAFEQRLLALERALITVGGEA